MKIGDYVKQYRIEHGLSMQAFGDRCGLSRAYISILEKGINPTTGKSFAPTIETLKKIADVTNADFDTLLLMLDGGQPIIVNATPSTSSSQFTEHEETLIKKYRQLDADGKEDVDDYVDMKLAKIQRKAEEEEQKLG